jgi:hypothetical protein
MELLAIIGAFVVLGYVARNVNTFIDVFAKISLVLLLLAVVGYVDIMKIVSLLSSITF